MFALCCYNPVKAQQLLLITVPFATPKLFKNRHKCQLQIDYPKSFYFQFHVHTVSITRQKRLCYFQKENHVFAKCVRCSATQTSNCCRLLCRIQFRPRWIFLAVETRKKQENANPHTSYIEKLSSFCTHSLVTENRWVKFYINPTSCDRLFITYTFKICLPFTIFGCAKRETFYFCALNEHDIADS